jgi:hypothetical protein
MGQLVPAATDLVPGVRVPATAVLRPLPGLPVPEQSAVRSDGEDVSNSAVAAAENVMAVLPAMPDLVAGIGGPAAEIICPVTGVLVPQQPRVRTLRLPDSSRHTWTRGGPEHGPSPAPQSMSTGAQPRQSVPTAPLT